jgi:hypothetical protein
MEDIKTKLNKPKSSMEVMIEEAKKKRYKKANKKIKELEEIRERLDIEVIKALKADIDEEMDELMSVNRKELKKLHETVWIKKQN